MSNGIDQSLEGIERMPLKLFSEKAYLDYSMSFRRLQAQEIGPDRGRCAG